MRRSRSNKQEEEDEKMMLRTTSRRRWVRRRMRMSRNDCDEAVCHRTYRLRQTQTERIIRYIVMGLNIINEMAGT